MKKTLLFASTLVLLLSGSATASAADWGEEVKAHFKPYGFVRSYGIFDSRKSSSLSEEIFYFLPYDHNYASNGQDLNAVPTVKFQALTSRLGLDIVGYRIGSTAIDGKIEGDFYCMSSGGNVATFRLRQAYANLHWDEIDWTRRNSISLLIGQAWHPLAVDMPDCVNLETGVPFNPFSRSAQIMFNLKLNHFTLSLGALEQMQYRSVGPSFSGRTVTTVGSNNYAKYALIPEGYAGITFQGGGFLAKAGVDVLYIKPRYGYTSAGEKIKDKLFTVNPFVYFQFSTGNFRIKAKSVYAQAGEHLFLVSGYALTGITSDSEYIYSPLQQSASFLSLQFGRKWQGMVMFGYIQNFGTIDPVIRVRDSQAIVDTGTRAYDQRDYNLIFVNTNGFKNVNRMVRATPTVVYNLGKMQFALEYNITGAQFGDLENLNKYGLATENLHWVFNHRASLMAKYTF